jgi:hypothetical protein
MCGHVAASSLFSSTIMSDILTDNLTWLWTQQKRYRGISVAYCRGLASIAITAVFGKTTAEQADQYGIVQRVTCVDFLIEAIDLDFEETGQITPISGDQIKRTVGSNTFVYEVMSPGDRPAVEPSEPGVLRIHTKLVDTETET